MPGRDTRDSREIRRFGPGLFGKVSAVITHVWAIHLRDRHSSFHSCWSIKFKDKTLKRRNKESMFPPPESFYELEPLIAPDIEQFKLSSPDELNWMSTGKLIVAMYEHFKSRNETGISYEFDFDQLFRKKVVSTAAPMDENMDQSSHVEAKSMEAAVSAETEGMDDVTVEVKNDNSSSNTDLGKVLSMPLLDGQETNSAEGSAEDSDANAKDASGPETALKPKQSRRRGSDLQMLERWRFWDRNRKYSQRQKNKQNGRNEVDTSINGVLRKILAKYFE